MKPVRYGRCNGRKCNCAGPPNNPDVDQNGLGNLVCLLCNHALQIHSAIVADTSAHTLSHDTPAINYDPPLCFSGFPSHLFPFDF